MIQQRQTRNYQPNNYEYGAQRGRPHEPPPRGGRTHSGNNNWRDSNNYREDYFERNKGIGGFCYICSQCFKPMFRKSKIQVDHIIPPSRFAVKRKRKGVVTSNSLVARFLNHSFNCAAICPTCNMRKSNTMDSRIIRGYAMKAVEIGLNTAFFIITVPFIALASAAYVSSKILGALRSRGKR